jgi:putative NIF3 family GTP cyclohydrolase 1 type 2
LIKVEYLVQIATPRTEAPIKSIAVCAGSGNPLPSQTWNEADLAGGSLLKDVPADLLLTGEMSHVSDYQN